MAHEKTEPAMMAAHVVTGCDADPHKPTLRWKLKTMRMTLSRARGKTSVGYPISTNARAAQSTFVMSSGAVPCPFLVCRPAFFQ